MKSLPGKESIIVPGFTFASASAGIKQIGKKDLALIFSEKPAVIAGVFTTNRIKAAPLKLAIENIASQKGQAIIINSGNANACTGEQGLKDAMSTAVKTATELNIPVNLVYVSSTGVIGRPLPIDKIKKAIPGLVRDLSPISIHDVASAIMTTDTFPKTISKKIRIGNKTATIAGIAKGSGMICPNMATMLCFITTDISVSPGALDQALKESVNKSFNRLTIDNDRSTNDTALVMANGILGNKLITKNSPIYPKFKKALNEITYSLSRMLAEDGEGATKIIEVTVKGARTEAEAEMAAMSIANSMLVKTAIYGNDPNWGRIIAAAGYSGAEINEQKTSILLNKTQLVKNGVGTNKEQEATKLLSGKEISITINLGTGSNTAKVLTCDLTGEYIKINADYTT